MICKAEYSAPPAAVMVCNPPGAGADIWLRKNVQHEIRTETDATGRNTNTEVWTADEAHMRLASHLDPATVESDFEQWWETAASWQPPQAEPSPSTEERLSDLERATNDNTLIIAELLGGGAF